MNLKEEILNELSALSTTVAAIPRLNVYSVPDGYFNHFSDSVLALIHPEEQFSFEHSKQSSMSVPEGYFEGLADSILNKIKQEGTENAGDEIKRISPAVAQIGNSNVYTVPEAYFESLDFLISQRIPKPAQVVQMRRRPAIYRQMIAAVVVGIMGISLFSLLDNKSDKSDLVPVTNEAVMAKAGEIIRNNSFEKELASISDKDIESYLSKNGQDVNAALVAATTDDAGALPATDEYLINENTLDEFLNKMNLNN